MLYLRGISLVRRNEEWHHFDPFGTAGVITNGTAFVISGNLYDLFGVLRYEQGSAQTPWRWAISPRRRHVVVNGTIRRFQEGTIAGELKQEATLRVVGQVARQYRLVGWCSEIEVLIRHAEALVIVGVKRGISARYHAFSNACRTFNSVNSPC